MPSSHRRLFEELGLLSVPPEANPLEDIGMRDSLARGLMEEDSTGAALREMAARFGKALATRYHSDTKRKPDDDRFHAIREAASRISDASSTDLRRWLDAPVQRTVDTAKQKQQLAVVERAAELVRQNIELGHHPLHYSQVQHSQGILLRRNAGAMLIRTQPDDSTRVQPARNPAFDTRLAAASFHRFLREHRSFGLEPGTGIATYIDEQKRASVLTSKYGFMMDITNPVRRREAELGEDDLEMSTWSNSRYPLLVMTRVPENTSGPHPKTQLVSFPHERRPEGGPTDLAWDMPLQIAGTLEDARPLRRSRTIGAAAIGSAETAHAARYFSVLATTALGLLAEDVGYSPLIKPDRTLLLYDSANGIPVATDAAVIGMLGNGAQTSY